MAESLWLSLRIEAATGSMLPFVDMAPIDIGTRHEPRTRIDIAGLTNPHIFPVFRPALVSASLFAA